MPRVPGMNSTRSFTLPLRVVSEANQREHWASRAKRVKCQRQAIAFAWYAANLPRNRKPEKVILTRLAPRRLDSDGNVAGFKACRDEVAALCGFDDRDESVSWLYAQEPAKGYGVRVEVFFPEVLP